jgi:hypothetical protein
MTVPDGGHIRKQHDQPVDARPMPAVGGMPYSSAVQKSSIHADLVCELRGGFARLLAA